MKLPILLLAASIAAPATLVPQDAPGLLDAGRRELLHEALSGERAKDHVIQITRHHRIQGSRGYRGAAAYVLDQLRAAGLSEDEAWIESFPSDGRRHYQTWQSPSGWHVERAELRMLEPKDELLVGYPEIGMSLITYSNPGRAEGELVFVGQGTSEADYAGLDVKGRLVLATGYGGAVHRLAVLKHGAAAVVCYLDDERALEYPDMLAYTGMWPESDEPERTTFGFNLTQRQGRRLRELVEAGQRVVLRGTVEGPGLEPDAMEVVVARIAGAALPDEELVLSAHLDHPKESANDNASGSAAILDIASTLHGLIADGRLPRPRRTLRFLWVPEWYGTMAWIDAHEEARGPALGGKLLANLNLDMVGEDLEKLHSRMILTRTPDSIPSVLNDVIADMAAMVDRMDIRTPRGSLSAFNWRHIPYSGGSDHMMFIDRKVPGLMFSHSPDYTHHTSEDTPDKVDPVELERNEVLASGAALYLSDLSEAEAAVLIERAAGHAAGRLGAAGSRGAARLAAPPSAGDWAEAENLLRHQLAVETAALESVAWYRDGEAVRSRLARALDRLRGQAEALRADLASDFAGRGGRAEAARSAEPHDARVPRRVTRGPLDFGLPESRLEGERLAWYERPDFELDGTARFELVNLIDGERNVSDIRDTLSAELGPVPTAVVGRYLEDLVAAGVMAWR
jgi:hypothetical protein